MAKQRKRRIQFEAKMINAANAAVYTRDQADGAIPNGTLVEKCNSVKGDAHQDGAPAHVLGSLHTPEPVNGEHYGYFVEWLDKPNVPCAIAGSRIRVVSVS